MKHQDTFSIEEFRQILEDLDVNVSSDVVDEVDGFTHTVVFECDQGNVEFTCVMGGENHAFARVALLSVRSVSTDPIAFADGLNSELMHAAAHVCIDDAGDAACDESGEWMIMLRKILVFDGGVTPMHVKLLLSYWLEELYVFSGLDGSDDSADTDDTVADGSVRELGLVEQIEWLLGLDGIPRTARQVASFLMRPKHEVNSELYRNTGTFRRDDSQPPRWTVEQN